MARLDLDDLGLFRHIAEAGSITGGAARAHLALAAASTRLRGMETTLGVRLMERARLGVTPTPAGQALLAHARAILASVERMREDLSAYAGGATGHVRVLSNTNALTEFLPERLAAFLAASPGTTVDIRERLSDEIVGLVAEGVAEIGIVAATVETGMLETLPFSADRFVVVVARDHPLAERAGLAFAALADNEFVGLDRDSALQRFLAGRAARQGWRPRLRVQLRGFDAVCRMVEAGVGVGVVPETSANRAARTMAIAIVPLEDPWAARDLRICVRSLAALPPSARRLVGFLTRDPGEAPSP